MFEDTNNDIEGLDEMFPARANIIMIFSEGEYPYNKIPYKFSTDEEKKNVNELALKIREERGCMTRVEEV